MDFYSEDSAHVTHKFSLNDRTGNTLEDKLTHKRWARSVLTFYVCLFLAGAVAIGIHQTSSSGSQQHASLLADIR